MTIQSAADLQGLQRVGQIVAVTLNRMREALTPGMTTAELDQIGRTVLEKFGRNRRLNISISSLALPALASIKKRPMRFLASAKSVVATW